jgi:16S rRNA A1518/A1519 N6-dimethyltransferase RsmA/KsgA/DIM1 with predicted DNA glycosylase/AP lyase activity
MAQHLIFHFTTGKELAVTVSEEVAEDILTKFHDGPYNYISATAQNGVTLHVSLSHVERIDSTPGDTSA